MNCNSKLIQYMATPTNHDYCPSRIYVARGPWHFEDIRNIFLPNIIEDQKQILPSECRAPGQRWAVASYYST